MRFANTRSLPSALTVRADKLMSVMIAYLSKSLLHITSIRLLVVVGHYYYFSVPTTCE